MNKSPKEGDLVTTKEALALLKISRPTLYRLMDEGVLEPVPGNPALMRQKRLYFLREDVERVLCEGRKPKQASQD